MTIKHDGTFTGRRVLAVRVDVNTPERLAKLAMKNGFYYLGAKGRKGSAGQLMDAIANGTIVLNHLGA